MHFFSKTLYFLFYRLIYLDTAIQPHTIFSGLGAISGSKTRKKRITLGEVQINKPIEKKIKYFRKKWC
jgi:hypothetical protein